MNSDDFEKRLEGQIMRPIPGAWRREILRATQVPAPARDRFFTTLYHRLSTLLWPCPQAWAGLAAIWLVILTMNFATREPETKMAKAPLPSLEAVAAMKEQRRLYLELAELHPKETAQPAKPSAPRPRSERRKEFQIA